MINFIKQNYCKIILILFQTAFLGGTGAYVSILQDLQKEIEPQLVRAEKLVQKVEKGAKSLHDTGKTLEKTGQKVNSVVKSIEDELKKVKKACKRIL